MKFAFKRVIRRGRSEGSREAVREIVENIMKLDDLDLALKLLDIQSTPFQSKPLRSSAALVREDLEAAANALLGGNKVGKLNYWYNVRTILMRRIRGASLGDFLGVGRLPEPKNTPPMPKVRPIKPKR